MSKPEKVDAVIHKGLSTAEPKLQAKLLQQEVFRRWREIFQDFAEKIMPVRFDGNVLIVDSQDNSLKDLFKYSAQTFVDRINKKLGQGVVSKIKFGRNFDVDAPKETVAQVEQADEEIELTAEEIADCERKSAVVSEPIQRAKVLAAYINRLKTKKLQLRRGWHKCALCQLLCPPAEKICDICRVRERERLRKEIRKIFRAKPSTPFRDIQRKVRRLVPHLRDECTLEAIESARMELILETAARVSYGDNFSSAAKFLVMLIRQLPEENLTPAIINRTLKEFRFNLADQPRFEAHEFSKLQNLRKTKKPAALKKGGGRE